MEDMVDSKAMTAPGILGAITTIITGTLASQFGLPGQWTALAVSFLLGSLVLADKKLPSFQRIVFYFINSLIIFTMAMGINSAGVAATKSAQNQQHQQRSVQETGPTPFFHQWF